PLPAWDLSVNDFLIFLLCNIAGQLLFGSVGAAIASRLAIGADAKLLLGGAIGQLGVLAGLAVFHFGFRPFRPSVARGEGRSDFVSGGATFLMLLPLLLLVGKLWEMALERFDLPVEKQDLIELFLRLKSPGLVAALAALAIVGAPLTEELVFRGGLFRYLRTRWPRAAAVLVPAAIFATLHFTLSGFAPLLLLAIVFSLAYERTGRIGTTIVAHALFNLNSILLILAGAG